MPLTSHAAEQARQIAYATGGRRGREALLRGVSLQCTHLHVIRAVLMQLGHTQ